MKTEIQRKCIVCGGEIRECMGFVLVRDITNKRIPVREICSKCSLVVLGMNEDQLIEWLTNLTSQ